MALPLSKAGRRYGTLPAKRNFRDLGIARMPVTVAVLPPTVDLTPDCGPVRDQADQGSCTGHAGYAMRSFLLNKYQPTVPFVNLSPEFIYTQEKVLDGSTGDPGSTGRTCVKVLNQFGVCPETDFVYSDVDLNATPSPEAFTNALNYKAGAYHFLTNVQDMKLCLASGYGFIVGFTVFESFEADSTASSGLMPVPQVGENVLGGHEVFFCGYSDAVTCPGASAGAFKVQNSWGTGWGQSGFFWFPYQCASDSDILMDAIIQHLGKPW
jgi:C1A family cysteine protease